MDDQINPDIQAILSEDERRMASINATFNPITGEGSVGERKLLEIPDFPLTRQWLPLTMFNTPLVQKLIKAGSIDAVLKNELGTNPTPDSRLCLIKQFTRIRIRHDFPFWAAAFVKIKLKGGGEDVNFRLTRPQRRFVGQLEQMRLNSKPIRLILLKARQWGGSTTSQLYMAWLQLVHRVGLNSLIIAHQGAGSDEIKDMFDRMIRNYPLELLHSPTDTYPSNEPKIVGVGHSGSIQRVPQRNCKIKIGTAERPDSCRGGDYNLVHLSEVGVWKKTDGRSPEDIVASACTGIMLRPYTMIVYESTAKGSDNFFHREYLAAKKGKSQFKSMFIPWYEIEWNSLPFSSNAERNNFAAELWENRDQNEAPSERQEPGAYLWRLWSVCGASLEAIHWYVNERAGKSCHEIMASECPSDDIEAFVYSGANVFDPRHVDAMRNMCRQPRFIGEVAGMAADGPKALEELRFTDDKQGHLHIWETPDIDPETIVTDRYLVVVDVGKGRTAHADNSVIAVFDRIDIADCGRLRVVAEWVGHIPMDLLAWKATQIAAWYSKALLVIESNTLESNTIGGATNHSGYILNLISEHYDNLYYRTRSPDDIRDGVPVKYGFHTNASTKPVIIDGLIRAVREQEYIERSEACLEEYMSYVRTERGSFEAPPGRHDDRLMTRAIALHISAHEMPVPHFTNRNQQHKKRKGMTITAAKI